MKKFIFISCFLFLISGCGPQFIYPNLDRLIPWYIDDYISLNSEQSTMLEQRLRRQLEWHCRTQLPLYARSLREMAKDLQDPNHPVSYERMQYYLDKFMKYWQDLLRQIGPDIADILQTASDAQLAELFDNLEKQNRKYKSEYVDLPQNELAQDRQERMTERLEHWISRLNSEQERAVLDWSNQLKPFETERLHYREKILAEFLELLEQRRQDPDFRTIFTEKLVHIERMRPPEYQMKVDYNTEVTFKFFMRIDRLLTATQRAHLVKRIESLAADFDKLSCDPAKLKGKGSLE